MKLGIVGAGVVGHACARAFMEFADVRVFDVVTERATHTLTQVLASDIIMVCLPTPQKKDSLECDLTSIEGFFDHGIDEQYRSRNYCLRSTVPIGTTRRLAEKYRLPNLCHSPEFLTSRCAIVDAMIPSRNIIGVPGDPTTHMGGQALLALYRERFRFAPLFVMSSEESEAVKLGLNSLFALKVAAFNQLKSLANRLSLDWDNVLMGILSDGRITSFHTKVPGGDGRPGFGGACLRKDLADLISCFSSADLPADVFQAANDFNDRIRGKE